jgi:release factor glutamine methyltransferase
VSEKSWALLELLRWTTAYLTEKAVPEPRLTAELLLAGALRLKRLDLYLQFDRPLRPEELADFKARLRRRVKREPLQYIEGEAAFRELRLQVDPRVLIPRPETELLVGEVLRWADGRPGLDVLDVGTGSGAIALSLAVEGRFSRVVASDLSADALAVARMNYARIAPETPVEFREGNVYDPVRGESFDVVVSNPPYVALEESMALGPEVREWEPHAALFAGSTGLDVLRELIRGAPGMLKPGGLFALEIGASQAPAVVEMIRGTAGFGPPRVSRDLAGRDRMVLTEFAGSRHRPLHHGSTD